MSDYFLNTLRHIVNNHGDGICVGPGEVPGLININYVNKWKVQEHCITIPVNCAEKLIQALKAGLDDGSLRTLSEEGCRGCCQECDGEGVVAKGSGAQTYFGTCAHCHQDEE